MNMIAASTPGNPSNMSYRLFMGAVGVIMLGWGIAFAYAEYQSDQCVTSANARLEGLTARTGAATNPAQGR
jgi:hypothetical protein